MQELVDSLILQTENHLHGPARPKILKQLQKNPTADAVAAITYEIITGMDEQIASKGAPLELDVIMAVATETIDILLEIMEAMGMKINVEEMREESLLKMVLLHMQVVEKRGDPEEKAAAEEMLAVMTADGTMEEGMKYVQSRASMSPEQMQQMGQQMAAPKQNPMAAGVQQGLMQG